MQIIRLNKGDELFEQLEIYCQKNKIKSAVFWGLGATSEIILGHYNLKTKKYTEKTIKKPLEIASLFGNVGVLKPVIPSEVEESLSRSKGSLRSSAIAESVGMTKKEQLVFHCHGVFSDKEMKTVAGHLKKLIVAATCEIVIEKLEQKIIRQFDEEIGLNLIKD